ncbi:MAG: excinuclease ABC subunit UvrC [Candidatus Gracilibacteria bacterium]|nr:excinuclease ABC subunit UvrC [Candidatus Gracilibacteria bacterium]
MSNNNLENILKNIPSNPGIYKFFDKQGKIIYIGKSGSLHSRVNSYFLSSADLNLAKKKMIKEIENIEYIITNNKEESLILESTLIKKHKPKYNILMKDDKNYIYIKITAEAIPKIIKTRIKAGKGDFFGPYTSSFYVANILKIIKKVFFSRSCNIVFEEKDGNIIIKLKGNTKIPCLDYYIGLCSAPCLMNKKNIDDYLNSIREIKNFLSGNIKEVLIYLEDKMKKFATDLKFEQALKIKETIESIKILDNSQIVRDFIEGDYDIINYIEKYDKKYIGVMEVRDSKISGYKNFKIEDKLDEDKEFILEYFIENNYLNYGKKLNIIVPFELNIDLVKISIETPKIGGKLELLKLVYKNLFDFAYKDNLDSLSTKNFTKKTQENLLEILGYKKINKDILFECNDISHISGNHTVASRTIIENGKTNPAKYRKYRIKSLDEGKIDDFASMKEVLTRRLKEIEKTSFVPDLIIIDGGKGQLSSVIQVVDNFKSEIFETEKKELFDKLQFVSIAKREEELFLPGEKISILLEKDSEELRLVQKIRDEAHRFAITFNRDSRIKSNKKNMLEDLPGIGPKTRQKLLKEFGNLDSIFGTTEENLSKFLTKSQIETFKDHGLI